MTKLIAIFLGGGIGASLRWLICELFSKNFKVTPYYATLAINIAGSFVLGLLFWHFMEKTSIPNEYKLFFTVGLCGGFTTFSTFALENFTLLQEGEFIKSFIYILMSVIFSVLGVILGVYFAKHI